MKSFLRHLFALREAIGLSMDALWLKSGVSRDTISRIEGGDTIPGEHVLARMMATTRTKCRTCSIRLMS